MQLFGTTNDKSGWQMVGESMQGLAMNTGVLFIGWCTASGVHNWTNSSLNWYLKTTAHSVKEVVINIFSLISAAWLGGWVSNKVGYSAIPLAAGLPIPVAPLLGLIVATLSSGLQALVFHERVAPVDKKCKK